MDCSFFLPIQPRSAGMAGVLEDVWQSTSSSASSASMGPSIVGASGDAPLGKQEVFQLLLQERRYATNVFFFFIFIF